jgi:hypothetical protein
MNAQFDLTDSSNLSAKKRIGQSIVEGRSHSLLGARPYRHDCRLLSPVAPLPAAVVPFQVDDGLPVCRLWDDEGF